MVAAGYDPNTADDTGDTGPVFSARRNDLTDRNFSVIDMLNVRQRQPSTCSPHSTVTDFARFLGLSTSCPRMTAA